MDYDELKKYSYNVAMKYLKNKDDADDVSQIAILELFKQKEKIKIENPKTWVYSVTRNQAFSLIKRNKKFDVSHFLRSELENLPDCNECFEKDQITDSEIKNILSDIEFKVYYKFFIEKKKFKKISEELETTTFYVNKINQKVRRNIKSYILKKSNYINTDILTYNEYIQIRKLANKIVSGKSKVKCDLVKLIKFDVRYENGVYTLCLFGLNKTRIPDFKLVKIKFENKKIKIIDLVENIVKKELNYNNIYSIENIKLNKGCYSETKERATK